MAPEDLIAGSLAPAVAMSTAAILATSLQARYSALVDRLRELAAESRALRAQLALSATEGARLGRVERQMGLMLSRGRLVQASVVLLYLAIACFLSCAMALAFSARGLGMPWRTTAEGCFLGGLVAMLAGVACEVVEMRLAFRIVRVEVGLEGAASGTAEAGPASMRS